MPKYRKTERAIRVLGNPDANGDFPKRVAYDGRGENLKRKLMEDIGVVYKCTVQEWAEPVK